MLALLLGLCASHAEDAAGTPTQQQLLAAIEQQVGRQQFLGSLDAMLTLLAAMDGSSAGGSQSSSSSFSSSALAENVSASPAFAAFLIAAAAEVRARVTGETPSPAALPTPAVPAASPQTVSPVGMPQQGNGIVPATGSNVPNGMAPPAPPFMQPHANHMQQASGVSPRYMVQAQQAPVQPAASAPLSVPADQRSQVTASPAQSRSSSVTPDGQLQQALAVSDAMAR
jgi:hypothetical protein